MNFKALISSFAQHYERVLAVVVMLMLVLFSAGLVFRVSHLQTRIRLEDEARPKSAVPQFSDLRKVEEALALFKNPPMWTTNNPHRLFVAPYMKVLNPTNGFPERFNVEMANRAVSEEGLPYHWLRRYELSTKQSVAQTDPDGDGFTVREEFDAGTDPRDPNSKPDVALKLRVAQILRKPFPFIFNSIAESAGGIKYGVTRKDGAKSHFVKLGEMIPDKESPGWKALEYHEKYAEIADPGIRGADGKPLTRKTDVSELVLQKDQEPPVVLVKNKGAMTDEFFARIYFILDKRYFDVAVGSPLELQNIQYQVISIKQLDDQSPEVVVKRVDPEAVFKLLILTPDDLRKFQQSPSPLLPEGFPHRELGLPGFPQ